ncbi:BPTD_2524 family lipoprotein [Achromobacter pestifer]
MRKIALMASVLTLSGCSVGITKGGYHPTQSFSIPTGYQEAFRRAEASLRECHSGSNPLLRAKYVNGNLFTDQKSGVVRVTMDGWTNDMVRVDLHALSADQTQVDVVVWGGPTWDEAEITAVKSSMQTGQVVCRAAQFQPPKAGNAY